MRQSHKFFFSSLSRRTGIVLSAAILGLTMPASFAHADSTGQFYQVLCANPDTGKPVGGGVPDGIERTGFGLWVLDADCSRPATRVTFQAGAGGTIGLNTFAALHYDPTPDGNTSLVYLGGSYYRSLTTNPANEYGTLAINLHAGPDISDVYGTPRGHNDSGDWYGNGKPETRGVGLQRGNINTRFTSENYVSYTPVGNPANTGFHLTVACRNWTGCTVDGGQFTWTLYGGKILLEDTEDPEISGTPGGNLLTDPVLKGSKEVTLNARDQGTGVYGIQILVDDQPIVVAVANTNNGRCQDLNPATPIIEVGYRQPCKLSTGGTYPIDTTKLPEGQHNVKIRVCDAGLNCSTLANRSGIWIDNIPGLNDPPPPANGNEGNSKNPDPPERNNRDQSLCVVDKSKCSNGSNAGPNVTLAANWQAPSRKSKKERKLIKIAGDRATTTFGVRTVIRGQLLNKDNGQPIGNAKVRLYQTPNRPGLFPEDVGGVRTREDGRFTMIVPRGMPSRKLRFEYRPIEDEDYVAAQRELQLGVKASVQLRLSRKRVRPGQSVTFLGRLPGKPYPKLGKQISILGRSKGEKKWKTVAVVRVKQNGNFRLSYRFKRRAGRATFEFKAVSKFEEAYPYETGQSSIKRLIRI